VNRIAKAFEKLKSENKRGFIPFVTAGDPDLETTRRLLIELAQAGATVIELGVPFSDPMADGPVIQRASERALKHGFGIEEILEVAREAQKEIEIPIVLFSYFNPLLRYGLERLSREAKEAGVDGVLITDMTPEEADEALSLLQANNLDLIFLVAPTSTDERLRMIAGKASGFIYAVSRAGVTGAREQMSRDAETLVQRVRKFSSLPVAVGFGISSPEQVSEVWRYADAAVVGSAIVKEIEKLNGAADTVERIGEFARSLL
jgi:tryptophan synthase alpha chain